ncbi:glycosyltransferase family 2 protein [Christiangramia sp. SM2212]|uniref:Glycosyltransferase n=1 Tax=Christiangramia sediminicola TaxID=3073267 RepID=A0ABU1EMU1_9FLAO|nr:glycosyltransferase [Christiangramia sp. SM2212]MDR5589711.1 glycosyltransferase [Christiangramia sp. SM2212]
MELLSIIFAYRNREISRIKAAMDSLKDQNNMGFEVIFVNYGSKPEISRDLEKLLAGYSFIKYYYLEVAQQLWNKSRALNFGIKKTDSPYIFIADVDIIFSPDSIDIFHKQASLDHFTLFTMGYLGKKDSIQISSKLDFKNLNPERYGKVNGMILTSKKSFWEVKGYDEFFHFYGAEDVDLISRLENAGYKSNMLTDAYFYHIWHESYQKTDDNVLSVVPRLTNALRINQQHYFYHQREKITIPEKQDSWGEVIDKSLSNLLKTPSKKILLENTFAQVDHFFNEELYDIKNQILEVTIKEDPYYNSVKFKSKKLLGMQSQTYISLKEISNVILKKIIFDYRSSNYSFEITEDLKTIIFKIQL